MAGAEWIRWSGSELAPAEREALLAALSSEAREQLVARDYVWAERVGVIWKPVGGALRRARFTHCAHFETRYGAFEVDSAGSIRDRFENLGATKVVRCALQNAASLAGLMHTAEAAIAEAEPEASNEDSELGGSRRA
jgi:hypothetical protein